MGVYDLTIMTKKGNVTLTGIKGFTMETIIIPLMKVENVVSIMIEPVPADIVKERKAFNMDCVSEETW